MSEPGFDEEEVTLPTGDVVAVPRGEHWVLWDNVLYERVAGSFLAISPYGEAPSRFPGHADVRNETGADI